MIAFQFQCWVWIMILIKINFTADFYFKDWSISDVTFLLKLRQWQCFKQAFNYVILRKQELKDYEDN